MRVRLATRPTTATADEITIHGEAASLKTAEGKVVKMPLERLLEVITQPRPNSCGVVLADGVRLLHSRGSTTVMVLERPPGRYPLRWIASDSPAAYGPGAKYRNMAISLPYVIILAMFEDSLLSAVNECFFRVAPLADDDKQNKLLYPGLLNCSRFVPNTGRPLSWICTQHLNRAALAREQNPNKRIRLGLEALNACLFETGFNYSSEEHEHSSWYSESRGVDKRISTIERWEEATEKDPHFALGVPWLKTGLTVSQVVERMFLNQGATGNCITSSDQLARIMLNYS